MADRSALELFLEVADVIRKLNLLEGEAADTFGKVEREAKDADLDDLEGDLERIVRDLESIGKEGRESFIELARAAGASEDEVRDLRRQFDQLDRELGNLKKRTKDVDGLSKAFSTLGRRLVAALSVGALVQFGRASVQTKSEIDAMEAALSTAGDTAERDAELMAFLRHETDRLGFSYVKTGKSLASFEVSARDAGIADAERLDLMRQLLEVLRARQLSEADAASVITAVNQVASKGIVSMEELRQQIGERVPGALAALARELGLTVPELDKLVSSGKLLSEVGLPALIRGLRNEVADKDLQDGLEGLNKRLADTANLVDRIQKSFAEGFSDQLLEGIRRASENTEKLERSAGGAGSALGALADAGLGVADVISTVGGSLGAVIGNLVTGRRNLGELQETLEDSHFPFQQFIVDLIETEKRLNPEEYQRAAFTLGLLVDSLDDLTTAAGRAQALTAISGFLTAIQEEGETTEENLLAAQQAVDALVSSYEQAGQAVPGVVKSLVLQVARLRGVSDEAAESLTDVATAALSGSEQVEKALAQWRKAVQAVKDEFRDAAQEADRNVALLEAATGDLAAATEEQLVAIQLAVEEAKEAWLLYGQEPPPHLRALEAEIRKHLSIARDLAGAADDAAVAVRRWLESFSLAEQNNVQLAETEKRVQAALDAYELAGEEIPEDIQAIASELGVLSTAQQKMADDAEKETARALAAYGALVEGVAGAVRKIQESLGQKADSDLAKEAAELSKEIAEIEGQSVVSVEDLNRLADLKDRYADVQQALIDVGRSADDASADVEQVSGAIRDLFEGNEDALRGLDAATRDAVATALNQLQHLAQVGGATGDAIEGTFRRVADALELAGVDVSDLRQELATTEGGVFDVRKAFEALGQTAESELAKQIEGYRHLDEQQKERVKGLRAEEKEHKRASEAMAEAWEDASDRIGAAIDVAKAKCRELTQCLKDSADAV